MLKQSTARNLMVFLTASSDHVTGLTGATLTITASKNGAAFASITPTVTERGDGWYNLALTSAHTDTLGDLVLHITAASADPIDLREQVFAGLPGESVTVSSIGTDVITSTALASSAVTEIATGVRTELTTELARIDVATSTRLATAGYTAPPSAATNATAVRSELTTELGRIDVATSTRLATSGYTVPPTASANATAVRSELTTELGRIDVAVSTRLATSGYTTPPTVGDIADGVWDEAISGHLSAGSTGKALDDASAGGGGGGGTDWTAGEREQIRFRLGIDGTASTPSASPSLATPAGVRTELSVELARIDTTISSRLASGSYSAAPTASDNATAVLLAAETTPIRSDIRKVNNYTIKGSGTLIDPWGPV